MTRRLLYLLLSIGLLCGGLFNFIKLGDYDRLAHIKTLAQPDPTGAPIPDSDLVLVPAGAFVMGSPASEPGHDLDEVQHKVHLSAFFMDKYLVTQGQWQATMGSNPSYFKGGDRMPVEDVTWYDCIEFCNRLSRAELRTPCYSYDDLGSDPKRWPSDWKHYPHNHISCNWRASGYRLPTEAEWEYACRAGSTAATPFGPSLSSYQANFNGEHPYNLGRPGPNLRRTTLVGAYPPNAWGLYDMPGNISQWCWDWYADYPEGVQHDPRGPESGPIIRVYRGGSWFSFGADLRSANRFSDAPQFRLDMLPGGMRLARSLLSAPEDHERPEQDPRRRRP
jgi:formylglycine-generating enzyme required for sulfatase activity